LEINSEFFLERVPGIHDRPIQGGLQTVQCN